MPPQSLLRALSHPYARWADKLYNLFKNPECYACVISTPQHGTAHTQRFSVSYAFNVSSWNQDSVLTRRPCTFTSELICNSLSGRASLFTPAGKMQQLHHAGTLPTLSLSGQHLCSQLCCSLYGVIPMSDVMYDMHLPLSKPFLS